jgi:hypothetical protein
MAVLVLGKKLPIGTPVRSKRVGSREEFTGMIRSYAPHDAYNVIDGNGHIWHRDRDELTVLTNLDPHGSSSQEP